MGYQTSTLGTLQSRLADRYESTVFWTAEEGRLALNEGLRFWNLLVGYWKKRAIVQTVAGLIWYPIPFGLLYVLRVDFGNTPLVQTSFFDLDLGRPNWEAETTTTGGDVPSAVSLWSPAGSTLFAIWPADGVGARELEVDAITFAPQLALPSDTIDLGEEEISVLLGYALHVLTFKVGGPRFTDTLPLYKAFLAHAMLKNERLADSKRFRQLLNKSTRRDSVPGEASKVPTS